MRIVLIALAALPLVLGAMAFMSRTIVVQSVPLPTGMNANFLTQVNQCFIPVAAVYGYDLYITAGFRTLAEQAEIYAEGRNASGIVVSEAPPGHSLHNYGYAVDVADRERGYNIDWTRLINIAAYCHLESGGLLDLAHFEYRGGLSTDDFAAGKRPPPLTLPCSLMAIRAQENQPLTLADLRSCGAPKF
jgi:peptidoglycan L-alanyl-D-glutamate endopeptidase CwlK